MLSKPDSPPSSGKKFSFVGAFTTAARSKKTLEVGVVAVTSGTTWMMPPFWQTNSRWVSPGGVARQSGWLKVRLPRALTNA